MTKNMWFNGTSLSEKARRALENEKVIIVSHITGHIHTVYKRATIDRDAYDTFARKLTSFVKSPLTPAIFINFLRFKSEYKCLFQYHYLRAGTSHYITLEKLFEYEHSLKVSMNEETRGRLLAEVDSEEFQYDPVPGKIILNEVEAFIKRHSDSDLKVIETEFTESFPTRHTDCVRKMFADIREFIITEPRLPSADREFEPETHPQISVTDSRDEIISKIRSLAGVSEMALLTLYVYRDMALTDWKPFVKAAIERNPVCHADLGGRDAEEIYSLINELTNESIYGPGRLAQPDEVWNFRRGDGTEKAFLMADALVFNDPGAEVEIIVEDDQAVVGYNHRHFRFATVKGLRKKITIRGKEYIIS